MGMSEKGLATSSDVGSFDYIVFFGLGIMVIFIGVYFLFRKWADIASVKNGLRDEFDVIITTFIILSVACLSFFLGLARLPPEMTFWGGIANGFVGSLLEDILFFLLLGLAVLIVQRLEFHRTRKLEDRIDYLFNGKDLTALEKAYLVTRIQRDACDFEKIHTQIQVLEYDSENKLLKIDVTRRFRVKNYLTDCLAVHEWVMSLEPDKMPDDRTAIEVFPAQTTLLDLENSENMPDVESEVLSDFTELKKETDKFELRPQGLTIPDNKIRECRGRYRGWQPLFDSVDSSNPEAFVITVENHWDTMSIDLTNSLLTPVGFKFESEDGTKKIRLTPGDHKVNAVHKLDVPSGHKIKIYFTVETQNAVQNSVASGEESTYMRVMKIKDKSG